MAAGALLFDLKCQFSVLSKFFEACKQKDAMLGDFNVGDR